MGDIGSNFVNAYLSTRQQMFAEAEQKKQDAINQQQINNSQREWQQTFDLNMKEYQNSVQTTNFNEMMAKQSMELQNKIEGLNEQQTIVTNFKNAYDMVASGADPNEVAKMFNVSLPSLLPAQKEYQASQTLAKTMFDANLASLNAGTDLKKAETAKANEDKNVEIAAENKDKSATALNQLKMKQLEEMFPYLVKHQKIKNLDDTLTGLQTQAHTELYKMQAHEAAVRAQLVASGVDIKNKAVKLSKTKPTTVSQAWNLVKSCEGLMQANNKTIFAYEHDMTGLADTDGVTLDFSNLHKLAQQVQESGDPLMQADFRHLMDSISMNGYLSHQLDIFKNLMASIPLSGNNGKPTPVKKKPVNFWGMLGPRKFMGTGQPSKRTRAHINE